MGLLPGGTLRCFTNAKRIQRAIGHPRDATQLRPRLERATVGAGRARAPALADAPLALSETEVAAPALPPTEGMPPPRLVPQPMGSPEAEATPFKPTKKGK